MHSKELAPARRWAVEQKCRAPSFNRAVRNQQKKVDPRATHCNFFRAGEGPRPPRLVENGGAISHILVLLLLL